MLGLILKLSEAQLSKIIESEGFLDVLLGKLASPLIGVVVFLTENVKNTWNSWCKSRKRNQFSLFKQRYG